MEKLDAEIVENRLITREFLEDRLKEAEVVEIDDYYSNIVLPPIIEEMVPAEIEVQKSADRIITRNKVTSSESERETVALSPAVPITNIHKPMLTFTSVKLDGQKPTNDKEVSIEAQLKRLIARSSIRRRPLCEIYIDDQVYQGTIEKLEHGMVFLREAYARVWRQFPIDRIYRVKVI